MSRTLIPTYAINRVGYFPEAEVLGNPTDGMYVTDNLGETFLEIDNPGTLNIVVGATIYQNTVDGIVIPDKMLIAAGGSAVKFGPFPMTYYNRDDSSVYFEVDPDGTYGVEGTQLHFRAYDLGN